MPGLPGPGPGLELELALRIVFVYIIELLGTTVFSGGKNAKKVPVGARGPWRGPGRRRRAAGESGEREGDGEEREREGRGLVC